MKTKPINFSTPVPQPYSDVPQLNIQNNRNHIENETRKAMIDAFIFDEKESLDAFPNRSK